MKIVFPIIVYLFAIASCQSQSNRNSDKVIGGPCEGCEAIHEYGNKQLTSIDTLPNFLATSPKLRVTGIVYKEDGKTPAQNVILYFYHTNLKGIYETKGDEEGWARRHGYIRGWIRTGNDGKYTIYTFRPGAYPNGQEAEHIHITVKEIDKNEYYIDSIVFDDDTLLTVTARNSLTKRGGSGIVTSTNQNGILTMERDIILGMNIPNYK